MSEPRRFAVAEVRRYAGAPVPARYSVVEDAGHGRPPRVVCQLVTCGPQAAADAAMLALAPELLDLARGMRKYLGHLTVLTEAGRLMLLETIDRTLDSVRDR